MKKGMRLETGGWRKKGCRPKAVDCRKNADGRSVRLRLTASGLLGRAYGLRSTACGLLFLLAVLCGCSAKEQTPPAEDSVVVYTSLDQAFSEPILREFERQTGIKVKPVYDTEAAKTTGLVNRLISQKDRPDCDVYWNNEIVQTQRLADLGVLAPYESPNAGRIPPQFRDPAHRWIGFAARGRVIIYNTRKVSRADAPTSVDDLLAPRWRGQVAIARPLFGTTLTHMAVMHQAGGPEALRAFLRGLRQNQAALCAGNGPVRDQVAAGERAVGLTDTDDAYEAMQSGKDVAVVLAGVGGRPVLIPNTVSVIANAPHPSSARRLADYLLSADVERRLASGPSAQIPLGTDLIDCPTPWREQLRAPVQTYDVAAAARDLPTVLDILKEEGMDE